MVVKGLWFGFRITWASCLNFVWLTFPIYKIGNNDDDIHFAKLSGENYTMYVEYLFSIVPDS